MTTASGAAAATEPLDILFSAETPEGIALTLRPAGMVARSYAYLIDAVVRYAILVGFSVVLQSLEEFGVGVYLLLMFGMEWFYPVIFELLPGGATPGKRSLGLRVVLDSGLPVTPAASLVRNLLRVADFLPIGYGLGLLMMLLRADFKRLGDVAAGTLVVHVADAGLHGALPDAPPQAPAQALSARQQAAVIAWAGRARRLTPDRLEELARLAAPATGPVPEASPPATGETATWPATARLLGVAQWLMGRR